MEEIKLAVQTRKDIGSRKIRKVRREKYVPAIVYGDGQESTPIQVDLKEYEHIMRQYRGQNVIFRLDVMDGKKKIKDYSAIIREEQQDPVSDRILHIDFNRISLTKEVDVKVAIVTKGEPIGVKRDGGSLDHALWELNVTCLPTKIPTKIEIDVSHMVIGDAVHVKDIKLPEGVRTKQDPEAILVSVVPPMKEEAATPTETAPELEVTKEKKEKAPEAAAGAAPEPKAAEKTEKKPEKK